MSLNAATTANQDSVKSDHSYFKVPSADNGENGEAPKRKKGRPRKYNMESPSGNKTQTKLTNFSNNKDAAKSDSTSTSKSKVENSSTSKSKPDTPVRGCNTPKFRRRTMNCSQCANCKKPDCGKCRNCLDKPKFGGRNTKKQRCLQRICLHKVSLFRIYMPTYTSSTNSVYLYVYI